MRVPSRTEALMPVLSTDDDLEEQLHISYAPLTPSVIEDEKAQSYIEALNFACSRPDIRNIAVTGPYGAGKSSVLLTWEKSENNDFRVMTVSLADFEMQRASSGDNGTGDDKSDSDNNDKKAAKAEEKTIEYSILQQLLYKEKKSALPYSRLERISDVSAPQVAMMAAGVLLIIAFAAIGLLFLFPDYIRIKLTLPPELSKFLIALPLTARFGGAGISFFFALFLTLKKLHRTGIFDRRVSIDKIDILKGAISTRPTAPSLLNVYIDEIVYFFEQTQYNVVIFEDLDRHNDGAIFIKLREINQLINNCLPTDNPVRFIYAVRDNLFITPESRTKFFDFVMPVIPVMDSENASEHFLGKFTSDELEQEGFSECLARLALFIPDMRVMHNIANEFRLYRNIVNNGEDLKRLVSLISYKNLCSEDYHGIDQRNGLLYSIVAAYTSGKLRIEYCQELKNSLKNYQDELARFLNEKVSTKQDLRKDILKAYITDKTAEKLIFITNYSNEYYLESVIEDEELFTTLLGSDLIYVRIRNYKYNVDIATIDNNTLESMKKEYNERCFILHKKLDNGISQTEENIAQINDEIQKSFSYDLAFFIRNMGNIGLSKWATTGLSSDNDDGTVLSHNPGQIDFLYFLLSHGYLSTDYMAYRSVFMPGSLSTEDNNFIRAVTAGRSPDETVKMPLSNIANTVAKLHGLGMLMHDNAWHPQILWHLMYNNNKASLNTIMGMQVEAGAEQRLVRLASEIFPRWNPTAQRTYIQLMVAGSGHLSRVIHQIGRLNDTAVKHTLLALLLGAPGLPWGSVPQERREELQRIIDTHLNLVTAITEDSAQYFCDNLRKSGCSLTNIPLFKNKSGHKTLQAVAQEKVWTYSTHNLQNICLSLTDDEENKNDIFSKKPLTTLRSLRIPNLESYVYDNISSFIHNIFIHSDESELIPELLNSSMVSWDDVEYLTAHMKFVLNDISVIINRDATTYGDTVNYQHPSLYSLLVKNNRITSSWLNVLFLLDKAVDLGKDVLCEWLNVNYSSLSGENISLTEECFTQLIFNVVTSSNISKEALVVVTSSFSLSLITVPDNLPFNNAAVLIEEKWLAPTITVFEQLYQALHEEGDKLTPLLYALICTRPELLSEDYELVLFADNKFDQDITGLILNGGKFTDDVCIDVLYWLWKKDEALLSEGTLLRQQTLTRLSSEITDDRLKQALLIQCLKDGMTSQAFIREVLQTFRHQDYTAFLAEGNYRSIVYSDEMWALAVQLGISEFIRPPKLTHKNTRIRTESFRNGDKE
ncbi:pcar [Klebsiella pneumoniae]|uniref:YobI family P-loop NTPase n=1 Tax=Klebsiella pneumoniae TaxID=573 RepID=UPI002E1960C6|nr:pcar [Klebsiella pneumoniae]